MGNFSFTRELNSNVGKSFSISRLSYPALTNEEVLYEAFSDDTDRGDLTVSDITRTNENTGLKATRLSYRSMSITQPVMSSETLPKIYIFGKLASEHNIIFSLDADLSNCMNTVTMFHSLRMNELIKRKQMCRISCGGVILYGYIYNMGLTLLDNIDSHVNLSISIAGLTECLI